MRSYEFEEGWGSLESTQPKVTRLMGNQQGNVIEEYLSKSRCSACTRDDKEKSMIVKEIRDLSQERKVEPAAVQEGRIGTSGQRLQEGRFRARYKSKALYKSKLANTQIRLSGVTLCSRHSACVQADT